MCGLEAGKGLAMPHFHPHSPFPLGCTIPVLGNVGFPDAPQTSLEASGWALLWIQPSAGKNSFPVSNLPCWGWQDPINDSFASS